MALTSDGKLYGWGWNKVSLFLYFPLCPIIAVIQTAQAIFYYILVLINTDSITLSNGCLVPVLISNFICMHVYMHMAKIAMMIESSHCTAKIRWTFSLFNFTNWVQNVNVVLVSTYDWWLIAWNWKITIVLQSSYAYFGHNFRLCPLSNLVI